MNAKRFNYYKSKSLIYLFKNVINSLNVGENYDDIYEKKFIQLNLNAVDKEEYGEDIIYIASTKKGKFVDNILMYLENLDYYREKFYNKKVKKDASDYWLAMLKATSFTEMYNILDAFLEKFLP